MKRYCGACRGERGCEDCAAAARNAKYFGITGFWSPEGSEKAGTAGEEYLLAADIGTTTLAFVCADAGGTVLSSYSMVNPQRSFAADVIGRVDYACQNGEAELGTVIKEALKKGFLFVLGQVKQEGRSPEKLRFGIAGNTVMLHLLLGYPVNGLSRAPFEPYQTGGRRLPFSKLFGSVEELTGEVELLPCFSAFVGADLTAGAYFLDFFRNTPGRICLLADFGTNGELLLYREGRLFATSVAMGTAFEGGHFSYAADLFHLIAEARREDWMDEYGLLEEPYFSQGFHGLQQEDVRVFQLAKGTVRAGIELLFSHAQITAEMVGEVYLAGGLGEFCRVEDFFTTGLLPRELKGRTRVIGNSCLGGLIQWLKNHETMQACTAEVMNLAECPEFEEKYYSFMNFSEGE